MSLKLRDFAKSDCGSANLSNGNLVEESSDEDISYLPPESRERETREKRDDRSYSEVPHLKDEKPWFGPEDRDGSIKVQYPSTINGYGVDSAQLDQMEKMGLPTGFSFGHAPPERQRKGEKKTFFCEICLIELNSLDTMKSHVAGVRHMKKKLQLDQRKQEQLRRGEISEDQSKSGPRVVPIPNPVNTKIKVPVRLHEKIKSATEPVVGLEFIQEWIAVSDAEMEPYYECKLCGNKGIANGMFSHLMGFKHRQAFVQEYYRDDPSKVIDLSQSELLNYARRHAENGDNLNERIKTRRSDEEYPWPAGKAPWSIERGGTGIPPDRARENWGKNDEMPEDKPTVIHTDRRRERDRDDDGRRRKEGSSQRMGLPSVSSVRPATDQQEALKMMTLAEKLIECSLDFLEPQMTRQEFHLMKSTTLSVLSKLTNSRRKSSSVQSSPGEQSRPSHHSDNQRKRSRESWTPSPPPRSLPPPVKRERRSPSDSRAGPSRASYFCHDDRGGGRSFHNEHDDRYNGDKSFRDDERDRYGGGRGVRDDDRRHRKGSRENARYRDSNEERWY